MADLGRICPHPICYTLTALATAEKKAALQVDLIVKEMPYNNREKGQGQMEDQGRICHYPYPGRGRPEAGRPVPGEQPALPTDRPRHRREESRSAGGTGS